MYFLTNKENIIIAASSDVLQELNFQEMCSLSHALKEETIKINEEKQTLYKDENELYTYTSKKLYSILGELTLYNIYKYEEEAQEEEQTNITPQESKEESIPLVEETTINTKEEPTEISLLDTSNLELTNNTISELEIKELQIPKIPTEALELDKEIETKPLETPEEKFEAKTLEPIQDNKEELNKENQEYIKLEESSYDEPIGDISKIIEEKKEPKRSFFPKKLFSWGKKKKDKNKEEDSHEIIIEQEVQSIPEAKEEKEEIVATQEAPTLDEKFIQLEKALLEDEQEEKIASKEKAPKEQEESKQISIEPLNIQENAQKLNVDIQSYQVLIESYIEEIKTHLEELEKGNEDIKNMLIDAGEFLSLDTIVTYLKELNSENDNSKTIQKITKSIALLEKELPKSPTVEEAQEETTILETKTATHEIQEDSKEHLEEKNTLTQKATIKEEIKQEEPSLVLQEEIEEKVAEDAIELNDSEHLLQKIEAQKITINLKETAAALNLPQELVEEFLKDFLEQMKEHLDIFIEYYNNKDLDKLYDTAHMLKGAANNLRLIKIGETLLKLQKEDNFDNIALLIKKFAAQTKGLEDELKQIGA